MSRSGSRSAYELCRFPLVYLSSIRWLNERSSSHSSYFSPVSSTMYFQAPLHTYKLSHSYWLCAVSFGGIGSSQCGPQWHELVCSLNLNTSAFKPVLLPCKPPLDSEEAQTLQQMCGRVCLAGQWGSVSCPGPCFCLPWLPSSRWSWGRRVTCLNLRFLISEVKGLALI